MAFTSLKANKLRAFLTVLGILIGVATIITIMTVIDGLDEAFADQISSLGSDNLYVTKIPWTVGLEFFKYRNRKDITLKESDAIEEHATLVRAVAPMAMSRRTLKYRNETLNGVLVNGTKAAYKDVANAYPEYGRFMTAFEVAHRRNVCVLGWGVADKLFEYRDPLGKKIFVGGHPFHVVGVLEKRGQILGENLDSNVYIPIGAFYKSFGTRRSLMIRVKVVDPELLQEAKDELRGILRRVRKVRADEEDDFAINQQDVLTNLYNSLTAGLYAVAVGIGAISLLVGGIGIMNIMLVAVTERTREIGVRKAIGARRKDVLWQFLVESVVISAIGGLIGIALGFGFGQILDVISPIPAEISPFSVAIGLGFSSLVGIFFGLYPASKAARLDPIEALRYE
ncbi:FtsX-like permease family protein [candidate division KSB1 bacterium]|nr:FtsX-like permease family protein [candidate division KSB1 bacterium]NIR69517.1 FtsX-like permease family protein [candidate division KSB1 bacterium]NIS24285.1 FtsX-like permease family protein [candidate division KSB1 bacterium]NIT71200.1 FtsX-like permease family protein [candidate division KSB1 bacterium]NIU24904.1 FtsX-like permease family protein [candidate division KSB1 bacterium]